MPLVAALSPERQREAARLYRSGLSAKQTADRLGVGIDAAFYALRKLKVSRRSMQEARRVRFERTPLSFSVRDKLSHDNRILKLAGAMLYWAEGYKIGGRVDFANSDPAMARLFIKFLRDICGVDESRMRCHLYCYSGQDTAALTEYWSGLLNIPKSRFIKPYINSKSIPGPRGHRMVHGLIHICYSDKRLLGQILEWIDEYKLDLTRRW